MREAMMPTSSRMMETLTTADDDDELTAGLSVDTAVLVLDSVLLPLYVTLFTDSAGLQHQS